MINKKLNKELEGVLLKLELARSELSKNQDNVNKVLDEISAIKSGNPSKMAMDSLYSRSSLARFELSKKNKYISKLLGEINTIEKQLGNDIEVSDHAIVRYLERVENYKFSDVKANIIDDEIIEKANANKGTGKFINKSGLRIVMQDFVVITVLKKK